MQSLSVNSHHSRLLKVSGVPQYCHHIHRFSGWLGWLFSTRASFFWGKWTTQGHVLFKEVKEVQEGSAVMQIHFISPWLSLICHWSKHVTWPSPSSVQQGNCLCSRRKLKVAKGMDTEMREWESNTGSFHVYILPYSH